MGLTRMASSDDQPSLDANIIYQKKKKSFDGLLWAIAHLRFFHKKKIECSKGRVFCLYMELTRKTSSDGQRSLNINTN